MRSYSEYRKMPATEYVRNDKWLANRLMFLWKMCDVDPVRYSVMKLYEEEEQLRSIPGIDNLAFARHMDAPYDREIHRFRYNYFGLTDNNKQL